MTISEEESTSLSVNFFEDLDIIIMKEASSYTDASDDFTTDRNRNAQTMIQHWLLL